MSVPPLALQQATILQHCKVLHLPTVGERVRLPTEPWPAPTWPNGVDLDPDVLIWGVDAEGHLLAPSEHATRP